jgi:hypothetical protein
MAVNGPPEILNDCCYAATANVAAITVRGAISSDRSLSLHQIADTQHEPREQLFREGGEAPAKKR